MGKPANMTRLASTPVAYGHGLKGESAIVMAVLMSGGSTNLLGNLATPTHGKEKKKKRTKIINEKGKVLAFGQGRRLLLVALGKARRWQARRLLGLGSTYMLSIHVRL